MTYGDMEFGRHTDWLTLPQNNLPFVVASPKARFGDPDPESWCIAGFHSRWNQKRHRCGIPASLDVVIPARFQQRRLVSFVSSRIGRDWENQKEWFAYFRTAIIQAKREHCCVVSAVGTTCHRFAKRACQIFDIPFLELKTTKRNGPGPNLREQSAEAGSIHVQINCESDATESLDRDELMMALSDRVFVLGLSRTGKSFGRLKRLIESGMDSQAIWLAASDQLVDRRLRLGLVQLAVVQWYLEDNGGGSSRLFHSEWKVNFDGKPSRLAVSRQGQLSSLEEWNPSFPFLFHCTRRRTGCWPEQDELEFIDQVLFGEADDRSPFEVLKRLVRSRTILGSSCWNRTSERVVSLTECNLKEISEMRIFRPHLSRWDFEPYGIGIAQSHVESSGGQEVIYGTESDYGRLSRKNQYRFQVAGTKTAKGHFMDWTQEREWRMRGNLDFAEIPNDQVCIFVRSRKEGLAFLDSESIPYQVVYLQK